MADQRRIARQLARDLIAQRAAIAGDHLLDQEAIDHRPRRIVGQDAVQPGDLAAQRRCGDHEQDLRGHARQHELVDERRERQRDPLFGAGERARRGLLLAIDQAGLGLDQLVGREAARAAEQGRDLELVRPLRRVADAEPAGVPGLGDRDGRLGSDDVEQRVEVAARAGVGRVGGRGARPRRRRRTERERQVVGDLDGAARLGGLGGRLGGARVDRIGPRRRDLDHRADRRGARGSRGLVAFVACGALLACGALVGRVALVAFLGRGCEVRGDRLHQLRGQHVEDLAGVGAEQHGVPAVLVDRDLGDGDRRAASGDHAAVAQIDAGERAVVADDEGMPELLGDRPALHARDGELMDPRAVAEQHRDRVVGGAPDQQRQHAAGEQHRGGGDLAVEAADLPHLAAAMIDRPQPTGARDEHPAAVDRDDRLAVGQLDRLDEQRIVSHADAARRRPDGDGIGAGRPDAGDHAARPAGHDRAPGQHPEVLGGEPDQRGAVEAPHRAADQLDGPVDRGQRAHRHRAEQVDEIDGAAAREQEPAPAARHREPAFAPGQRGERERRHRATPMQVRRQRRRRPARRRPDAVTRTAPDDTAGSLELHRAVPDASSPRVSHRR